MSSENDIIIPADILHSSLKSPLPTSHMGQANSHFFAFAHPPVKSLPTSFMRTKSYYLS